MAKRSDMPQLFPPGYQTTGEPFTGNYEIMWSIYIRCNNVQKLHKVHIPALEALIGQPHGGKGWTVEKDEDSDPNLKRIIALQRLAGPYDDRFLLDFMKTLYRLAPFWRIQARLDPSHPHGAYVMARFSQDAPGSEPPAVVDVQVELMANFTDAMGGESGRYLGSGQRIS
ncbi:MULTISPECIES: hypothetical protein [unclassified Mesorhizobium]|uniref:hypothetical protein n=1 Tax=unclassified Mesorhizobium TaxID=325217 RepID=UPI00095E62C1|nr:MULTISPECIES: hypothetical protein [unclassified Mesorhizobium]MBN9255219.1 hypothetical protein [Mesorhizobium sp.]OJX82777.1 MAG: hypothetical protein BGO93_27040 [Mesorhizobium sp. 65-26]